MLSDLNRLIKHVFFISHCISFFVFLCLSSSLMWSYWIKWWKKKKKTSERFWTDKGWKMEGRGGGGGRGVDNLKTDFHAYYTNDFMIFDVAAGGLGGCGSLGGWVGGWRGLFLSLISVAWLSDGVIRVTSDLGQVRTFCVPISALLLRLVACLTVACSSSVSKKKSPPPSPNKRKIALIFK